MIKVIKFAGGLGNQMFQYAFCLALLKKHPFSLIVLDVDDSRGCHNGFELPIIFCKFPLWRRMLYSFLKRYYPRIIRKAKVIRQKDALTYYENILISREFVNCIYVGYWQSEKYFAEISEKIHSAFTFKIELLSSRNRTCLLEIEETESVAIHIRRGDYLREDMRLTFGLKYYMDAIQYIGNRLKDAHYFVFSDDMAFVKTNFQIPNAVYVDWNNGVNSWQDLYLMSLCKHNIIANSSFSWWGAWLNKNKSKIVIAPKIWFKGEYNEDIVPETWIRV